MVSMKIIAQAAPSAGSPYDLYTVPANKEVQATLHICNRDVGAAAVRVALRASGDSIANKHYIVYDAQVDRDDPVEKTDILMGATDVITVQADTANVSFSLVGMERDTVN